MYATLRQITIAYLALTGQQIIGKMRYADCGKEIYTKLGSKACRAFMEKVARVSENSELMTPYPKMAAEVNGWEMVGTEGKDATIRVLTGTGAILGEGADYFTAFADAFETAAKLKARKQDS